MLTRQDDSGPTVGLVSRKYVFISDGSRSRSQSSQRVEILGSASL